MERAPYIIRGGTEGRERLRVLSRVMQPTTHALLNRAGIQPGMACLEVGCGGGDLAFDLARMVGPTGRVVATDIDDVKLELARSEAEAQRLPNIEFRFADITDEIVREEFDFAHARFVLTHLRRPGAGLVNMRHALRRGGILVVEDIDFRGYFCEPENAAFWRYVDLYTRTARLRGADPHIGPRLPGLLLDSGFERVQMNVVQPAAMEGEIKLIAPLTMENIADAVTAEGLASRAEIDQIIEDLYEFASTPGTIGCAPRIVEAWGFRPHVDA